MGIHFILLWVFYYSIPFPQDPPDQVRSICFLLFLSSSSLSCLHFCQACDHSDKKKTRTRIDLLAAGTLPTSSSGEREGGRGTTICCLRGGGGRGRNRQEQDQDKTFPSLPFNWRGLGILPLPSNIIIGEGGFLHSMASSICICTDALCPHLPYAFYIALYLWFAELATHTHTCCILHATHHGFTFHFNTLVCAMLHHMVCFRISGLVCFPHSFLPLHTPTTYLACTFLIPTPVTYLLLLHY